MGVVSTYGELKQALKDYSARGGNATLAANLPVFIARAHTVLMRELRIPMLQTSTDLTINAERVSLPSDFRAVGFLWIDGDWDNPLSPTTPELRIREALQHRSGRPQKFALEGGQIAFGPTPDQSYTGKLLYYRALPMFSLDADTNTLLARHPFAYLYGALAELARFDKSDEDMASFEAMFQNELSAIRVSEMGDAMGGGTLMQVASGQTP